MEFNVLCGGGSYLVMHHHWIGLKNGVGLKLPDIPPTFRDIVVSKRSSMI